MLKKTVLLGLVVFSGLNSFSEKSEGNYFLNLETEGILKQFSFAKPVAPAGRSEPKIEKQVAVTVPDNQVSQDSPKIVVINMGNEGRKRFSEKEELRSTAIAYFVILAVSLAICAVSALVTGFIDCVETENKLKKASRNRKNKPKSGGLLKPIVDFYKESGQVLEQPAPAVEVS